MADTRGRLKKYIILVQRVNTDDYVTITYTGYASGTNVEVEDE